MAGSGSPSTNSEPSTDSGNPEGSSQQSTIPPQISLDSLEKNCSYQPIGLLNLQPTARPSADSGDHLPASASSCNSTCTSSHRIYQERDQDSDRRLKPDAHNDRSSPSHSGTSLSHSATSYTLGRIKGKSKVSVKVRPRPKSGGDAQTASTKVGSDKASACSQAVVENSGSSSPADEILDALEKSERLLANEVKPSSGNQPYLELDHLAIEKDLREGFLSFFTLAQVSSALNF